MLYSVEANYSSIDNLGSGRVRFILEEQHYLVLHANFIGARFATNCSQKFGRSVTEMYSEGSFDRYEFPKKFGVKPSKLASRWRTDRLASEEHRYLIQCVSNNEFASNEFFSSVFLSKI